jgi:hypothetical protein
MEQRSARTKSLWLSEIAEVANNAASVIATTLDLRLICKA